MGFWKARSALASTRPPSVASDRQGLIFNVARRSFRIASPGCVYIRRLVQRHDLTPQSFTLPQIRCPASLGRSKPPAIRRGPPLRFLYYLCGCGSVSAVARLETPSPLFEVSASRSQTRFQVVCALHNRPDGQRLDNSLLIPGAGVVGARYHLRSLSSCMTSNIS
jgi:hypothetical protein